MKAAIFFILLTVSVQDIESAKILAWFPIPSISHQLVFRPLTQELARRGHDVTVVTTHPAFPKGETPANLKEIDVYDIASHSVKTNERILDVCGEVKQHGDFILALHDALLNTSDIKKILNKNNNFDLVLSDANSFSVPLWQVLEALVIQVSSGGPMPGQLEAIGAPYHPFLYPMFVQRRIFNLTTLEKLYEIFTLWKVSRLVTKLMAMGESKKQFGSDLPPLRELEKNVDLLLLNQYHMWNNNQPVPPNVVFIGGIHKPPVKDLPQDLKTFIESSKHGIIYMSFGTKFNTSIVSQERVQCFIKAFSKLPYDVLLKWDQDELPGRTKNIRISKWFPQSDLLRHPNIKLFITHGGFQSTDEAFVAGVPLIGIPLSSDQWYNVEHYAKYKVGLQLDLESLDDNQLISAIETVIGDNSYRENVKKLNLLLRDQPMAPLERAVWWTEHVLRHGGANHLRTPAAFMSWWDYYEIKLVLVVVGLAMVVLLAGIGMGCCLIRMLIRKMKRKTMKKND